MAKTDKDIPTLTHIVHTGDDDMLNHFGASGLDHAEKNRSPGTVENATDIENTAVAELDIKDMPSITPEHATTSKLPKQDFSESMQPSVNKQPEPATKKELKAKIDQAITEAMPGIEAQLKGKLYTKFGV